MSNNNTFNTAVGAVGQFVAAHPELDPKKVEYTVQTVLRFLKAKKLTITLENMNAAWESLLSAVAAMRPETEPESATDELSPEKVAEYRKLIDSLTSAEMAEHLKDPETAEMFNKVLAMPRPKAVVPKVQKVETKSKIKLTPEELAVENLTSDQLKKILRDPAKAVRVNRILQGLEEKRRGQQ